MTKYWLGKKRSEETKLKISLSKKGKHLTKEHKNKISIAAKNNPDYGMRGKHQSKKSRIKIGLAGIGRKPWNYLDGRSHHPITRKTIKGRPISHIVWCSQSYNLSYIPEGFIIHHIDGNPENNKIKNLVMLPDKYHRSLHNHISRILLQEVRR